MPPNEALTEATVREALREVIDPEVGLNIVDVGLVYDVRLLEGAVQIDLTMTSPACPLGGMISDQVRAVVSRLAPPNTRVAVELVWDPPWNPSMMSEEARQRFGWK